MPVAVVQRLQKDNVFMFICAGRFDVDFTEVHSYMTRGEAILQSPEFSVSRKEGSIQELHDKVQVQTLCEQRGRHQQLLG